MTQTVLINGQEYQVVSPGYLGTSTTGYLGTGTTEQYSTYIQGGQSSTSGGGQVEDQARKREMRLIKNKEAARECRNKKKEYIKCLENRVAVLENQNKALVEELRNLKQLYSGQKN